jgi:4-hydroxybenzoate polyprenyltransferase
MTTELPLARFKTFLDLVKFEHTLFALPFAYVGMLLAANGLPSLASFIWITMAMVGARTAAMALNRLIDARIDAQNPRTAVRHLPRGLVKPQEAMALALVSLVVLLVAAANLGPLPLLLLPLAVLFLVGYSYTKRFTWLCHVWLGITIGAAAAGGWIAVTGSFAAPAWWLWGVVLFWMIGLDVIYATQDHEFDQNNNIESIPRRFGIHLALQIAAISHAIMWLMLFGVGMSAGLGWPYYLGVLVIGAILAYQHAIVRPDDLTRVNLAFFDANVWISGTMLVAVGLALL